MLLLMNKIPFRYECELQLEETTLYPDFALRHPLTGQVFYWEHFGMMDTPNYCRNATTKLQLYLSHRIIPTINLITTYETKDDPLNIEIVEVLYNTISCNRCAYREFMKIGLFDVYTEL